MIEKKHTPLPWAPHAGHVSAVGVPMHESRDFKPWPHPGRVDLTPEENYFRSMAYYKGELVCESCSTADSEFIAKACNMHYRIHDTLEDLIALLRSYFSGEALEMIENSPAFKKAIEYLNYYNHDLVP